MNLRRFLMFWSMIILTSIFVGYASNQAEARPRNPFKRHKQVKIEDPVKKYKKDFLDRYGFFVTREYVVDYYKDSLGVVGKEKDIFDKLKTIEDVDKFTEVFWKVRDTDPNTPEVNEFKELIDQRIQDIKDEVFASDTDIPLTSFAHSGGLKGDLAHVYLLYGAPAPQSKLKLSETSYHVELMVWYYFDASGRPLYMFLFHNRDGSMKLFKNIGTLISSEQDLYNPQFSPLKEISARAGPTADDLYDLWMELLREDPQGIFITPMFKFSDYDDVVLEGGDGKKRFGALDPPEPVSLTAIRFKPTFLGQPGDLTGREFLKNSYHSFIPADLRITDNDGRPSFTLVVGYADTDWEVSGDSAETSLDLRMSFQNKKTRTIKEFWVNLPITKLREEVEKKRGVVTLSILIDDSYNFAGDKGLPQLTLSQLVSILEPGTYIVNVDLRHSVTKKFAGGWREEIVIK